MNSRNVVVLLVLMALNGCITINDTSCDTWKVTGFYTPIEKEFTSRQFQTIAIKDFKSVKFDQSFVNAVRIEGWGKTRFGWYLGYYGGYWHKSASPLNALGYPLEVGAIAVDNRYIHRGDSVKIPHANKVLGISEFKAVDVGSGIKKQHVDIYTGEGESAKEKTFKLTGQHPVCFNSNRVEVETITIDS